VYRQHDRYPGPNLPRTPQTRTRAADLRVLSELELVVREFVLHFSHEAPRYAGPLNRDPGHQVVHEIASEMVRGDSDWTHLGEEILQWTDESSESLYSLSFDHTISDMRVATGPVLHTDLKK